MLPKVSYDAGSQWQGGVTGELASSNLGILEVYCLLSGGMG